MFINQVGTYHLPMQPPSYLLQYDVEGLDSGGIPKIANVFVQ